MSEIHRSKVGTYHPAICPCATDCKHRGQDWSGINNPDGTPARCPDCDYYVVHGKIVCRCDATWTINDTRGYIDGGPACGECGACECGETCPECSNPAHDCPEHNPQGECTGLSFAYICLDGGDALCEDCAEKAGISIVECDCA